MRATLHFLAKTGFIGFSRRDQHGYFTVPITPLKFFVTKHFEYSDALHERSVFENDRWFDNCDSSFER